VCRSRRRRGRGRELTHRGGFNFILAIVMCFWLPEARQPWSSPPRKKNQNKNRCHCCQLFWSSFRLSKGVALGMHTFTFGICPRDFLTLSPTTAGTINSSGASLVSLHRDYRRQSVVMSWRRGMHFNSNFGYRRWGLRGMDEWVACGRCRIFWIFFLRRELIYALSSSKFKTQQFISCQWVEWTSGNIGLVS